MDGVIVLMVILVISQFSKGYYVKKRFSLKSLDVWKLKTTCVASLHLKKLCVTILAVMFPKVFRRDPSETKGEQLQPTKFHMPNMDHFEDIYEKRKSRFLDLW